MRNNELIDDYLSNRLSVEEKLNFEQQMSADPSLKADVAFQHSVVEGVKKLRISELKTMLNNVPVTGAFMTTTLTLKIAASIMAISIVGTAIYFSRTPKAEIPTVAASQLKAPAKIEPLTNVENTQNSGPKAPVVTAKKSTQTAVKQEAKKVTEARPKINVADPSEELKDNATPPVNPNVTGKNVRQPSRIAVNINNTDKQYVFHYRFDNGKLTLFGQFDKSLYEILEINGDQHAVFLFYKESYYHLDERKTEATRLESITDPVLTKKLNAYRSQ